MFKTPLLVLLRMRYQYISKRKNDMNIKNAPRKFILQNVCKVCGKDSTIVVQLYPSQAWEYYCKECYENGKK
jgi:hypothetical protein